MTRLVVALGALSLSLVACGSDGTKSTPAGTGGASGAGGSASGSGGGEPDSGSGAGGAGAELSLTSDTFHEGELVPSTSRCVAPSPDLSWSGGATAPKGWALVLKDVTPGISNGFLHWVLYDVAPETHSLAPGVPIGYAPASPADAHQAPIWNGTLGFNGPCGGRNTYELTLYAVDERPLSGLDATSTGPDAVSAIAQHATAHVTMTVKSQP